MPDTLSNAAIERDWFVLQPNCGIRRIVSDPTVPAPHPVSSICAGCPTCDIRAAKGLPLYA